MRTFSPSVQVWRESMFKFCKLFIRIMFRRQETRGGLLSPKSDMDVPARPRKSDFLYTNLLPYFPPICIPFSKEKHPILTKLGAFYRNFSKIHPIYVIWAPSSLMKTLRLLYQFLRKSTPKRQAHNMYTMSM